MITHPDFVKKVLFIRLSSLGDIVKCVPAYRSLVNSFPHAQSDWLVDVRFAGAIDNQLNGGSAIPVSKTLSFRKLLKIRMTLQENNYDLVVDAHGNIRSGVFAKMTGASIRLGFSRGFHKEGWINSFFMTHRVTPQGAIQNRRLMAMSLAKECGGIACNDYPYLAAHPRYYQQAQTFLKSGPIILLHPGGSRKGLYKRWFLDRYAVLAKKLKDTYAANIYLVCGNREEKALCETIQKISAFHLPLISDTDLPGLMGFLAAADLVIGADSGPVHLADALGTPVVSIHGPKDPARYGPCGPRAIAVSHHLPCVFPKGSEGMVCRNTACKHRNCLQEITVDDVFAACEKTGFF
jgi:ADP-heptose:LPS heptosyltransferase